MKTLTVGSATIDTIAIIDSDRIERMTMLNADNSFLLLEEGRKTEAQEVSTHPGGGAINAAVAMARLGMDVAVLAKLGTDARADAILTRLAHEGISSRWTLRDARAPTGASVLISSHDRNAAIFTFRGANTLLEAEDLRDDAFAVDIVYVANLSNKSADCFPAIVGRAKAHGALVAANPGPRQLSARGQAFLENLAMIDILMLNRTEADLLVPSLVARRGEGGPALPLAPGEEPPALAARGLVAGGFEIGLAAYLRALGELGPNYVVITDGARGAFVGRLAKSCSRRRFIRKSSARREREMRSARHLPPIWRSAARLRKRCAPHPSIPRRWLGTSTPKPGCCAARNSTDASRRRLRKIFAGGRSNMLTLLPTPLWAMSHDPGRP